MPMNFFYSCAILKQWNGIIVEDEYYVLLLCSVYHDLSKDTLSVARAAAHNPCERVLQDIDR